MRHNLTALFTALTVFFTLLSPAAAAPAAGTEAAAVTLTGFIPAEPEPAGAITPFTKVLRPFAKKIVKPLVKVVKPGKKKKKKKEKKNKDKKNKKDKKEQGTENGTAKDTALKTVPESAPFLPKKKVDSVIKTAKKLIGTPYKFGGTTPKGFDCSGFLQYVFKQHGFSLPRTADEQYKLGKRTKKRGELTAGDLVYFTTYEAGASHCGIYLGDGKFIHASSSRGIRIDSLDDSYWKPRYYGGKHIVK